MEYQVDELSDEVTMQRLNIIDSAIHSGVFQTFTKLLEGSSLERELRGQKLFTLFAPVDIAFACLSPHAFNYLLCAENQGALANVLGFHAVPMRIMSHELRNLGKATTLCGVELTIDAADDLKVGGAKVLHADLLAKNGVIHGIDRLLMPAMSHTVARH
jgi:uncharacterized surface protein with fasciclin (FAS1) repeats